MAGERPAIWSSTTRGPPALRRPAASDLPTAHLRVEEVCSPGQCGLWGVRGDSGISRTLGNGKDLQSRPPSAPLRLPSHSPSIYRAPRAHTDRAYQAAVPALSPG